MGEVAAIAFFEELMRSRPADRRFTRLFVHGIGDEALGAFGASSKMNNHPDFLAHLCEIGTRVADGWLADHAKPWAGARRSICPGSLRRGTARSSAHPSLKALEVQTHED
jgi:hypothetical protein